MELTHEKKKQKKILMIVPVENVCVEFLSGKIGSDRFEDWISETKKNRVIGKSRTIPKWIFIYPKYLTIWKST